MLRCSVFFCNLKDESVNHLMVECSFSKRARELVFSRVQNRWSNSNWIAKVAYIDKLCQKPSAAAKAIVSV